MPSRIDHVVVISQDLDTAVANAESAGFTVVPGGTHAAGDTHNALIGFADGSYIELIAPTAWPAEHEHRWFPRLRNGGGLVDYCLLSADLATDVGRFQAADLTYNDPFDMGRDKPDGSRIDWRLATPPGPVGETGWPFLIEDVTPRNLRMPSSVEETTHSNEVRGIAGIHLLVANVDHSADEFAVILDSPPRLMTPPDSDETIGALFPIGSSGQWLMLAEPTSHIAREQLDQHGQGIWRLVLRTHDGPISPMDGRDLDANLFSGAHITLA